MTPRATGTALVLTSAVSFGTLAVLARGATDAGVGTVTLLFLRFGIAAPLLLALALALRKPWPGGQRLRGLALMGALYVGQSFCFFKALETIPASLVSLLLYLYPGFVTIGSVLILREPMTRTKSIALVLAIVGSLLTIGPVGGGNPYGLAFGLGTALFYSAYLIVGTRAMEGVDSTTGSVVVLSMAALSYAVWALSTGLELPANAVGWSYSVALALIPTVLAISTLLAGLKLVGPVNTSTLSAIEPLVTAVIAGMLLGERLTGIQFMGGALILAAVVVLARGSAKA